MIIIIIIMIKYIIIIIIIIIMIIIVIIIIIITSHTDRVAKSLSGSDCAMSSHLANCLAGHIM